jgi:hypothetical protein
MFEVAPFRCIICGARATPNRERDDHRRRLTLDHIIPRSSSRAPRPGLRNLIAICSPCNSSRGARPLRIWLQNKHRAGELVEAPDVVLHRIAIVRSMPVSRGVAAAMTSYFYPGFARAQRGRWSRRKAARGAVADLPF